MRSLGTINSMLVRETHMGSKVLWMMKSTGQTKNTPKRIQMMDMGDKIEFNRSKRDDNDDTKQVESDSERADS